ncbi:hypothetical protein ABIA48_004628 [Pseudomonas sp. S30_BP2TU TE3576]
MGSRRSHVRGNGDTGHGPEPVIDRQRFLFEDIQQRTAQLPSGQCLFEIVDVQMSAPATVDQCCAVGELVERGPTEDAAGFAGERCAGTALR